jgi:hypothetical protein
MSDGLTIGQLYEYASKVTATFSLIVILIAIYKQWLVPGWALKETQDRCRKLEEQNERWNQLLTRIVEPILPPRN